MASSLDSYPNYAPTMTLMDLPRELRDLIWDFAFRGSGEMQFREGSLSFSVRYRIEQDDKIEDAEKRSGAPGDEILDADTLLPISSDDEDDGEEADAQEDEQEDPEGADAEEAEQEGVAETDGESSVAEDSDQEEDMMDNDESISDIATSTREDLLDEPVFETPKADLRWLLTNRQVLSEGVEQFYRHAHCTSYSNVNYYWDYSHHFYTERYLAKKQQIHHPASVFTFAKITSISLSLRLGTETAQRNGKWYQTLAPKRSSDSKDSDDDLHDIIRHVQTLGSTALTHLNLGVWIFQTEPVSQEPTNHVDEEREEDVYEDMLGFRVIQGYEVDLSLLTGLGTRFKYVEIMLFPTYLRELDEESGLEGIFVVTPMLQRELARVAKIMVGGDGWIVRDWILKEVADQPWRLDVIRSVSGHREGGLEHLGFRAWPGHGFDGDNDTFRLQKDLGDGVVRWTGYYTGVDVSIVMPIMREESGDHLFQRTSVSVR